MKTNFPYFSDAGHGWIRVPHSIIEELGIADQISGFSYRDKRNAFLEEDMDAMTFIKAFEAHNGGKPEIHCRPPAAYRSGIRNKERYV